MREIDWYEVFCNWIVPVICGAIGAFLGMAIMRLLGMR